MQDLAVGCGAGFSGDRSTRRCRWCARWCSAAGRRLIFETLAERTLALAQLARRSDPGPGYEPLLDDLLRPVLGLCLEHGVHHRQQLRCRQPGRRGAPILALANELGLRAPRIAVVQR
jgi:hypothetical protein